MKNFSSLTKYLLCPLFLFAVSLAAFGAEPGAPTRDMDDARRPLASDQRPGSVLVFNLYTSGPTSADKADTDISITNINASQSAYVHLFFVADGGSTADSFICLTPNQTASFLSSDVDPGVSGYK